MATDWPFTPEATSGGWNVEARRYTGETHYILDEEVDNDPGQAEANANLIAAAPRLYRAVQALLKPGLDIEIDNGFLECRYCDSTQGQDDDEITHEHDCPGVAAIATLDWIDQKEES